MISAATTHATELPVARVLEFAKTEEHSPALSGGKVANRCGSAPMNTDEDEQPSMDISKDGSDKASPRKIR